MTKTASCVRCNSGLYTVVLSLRRPATVKVGKLGMKKFKAGVYVYTGSAKKGMSQRVARHRRREKPLRWHIDYLRAVARWVGSVTFENATGECALAASVISALDADIPCDRFGASDCHCPGHLAWAPVSPEAALARLNRLPIETVAAV